MTVALLSFLACVVAMLVLLAMLRRDRMSLGLPLAYLIALLLIHLPGAYAYIISGGVYGTSSTERGIVVTAVGAVTFVLGVWASRHFKFGRKAPRAASAPSSDARVPARRFWMFCLLGGWFLIYGINFLLQIPSVGAVVEKGGAVWMLGSMLGLAHAFQRRDVGQMMFWGATVLVYPILMLLLGGFLSYGSTAVIVVCSILAIAARRYWTTVMTITLGSFLGISVFVNYFAGRNQIRNAVWGGASMDERLRVVGGVVDTFGWFSLNNPGHLDALDKRLNQNYFVGVSAERLDLGQVDFLYGRSLWEGVISLIPRALWPDKPVTGGSGSIVADMTGLQLNTNTSWGVGNVMEFYINFGMAGVVAGFLALGFVIGALDRRAVESLRDAQLGTAFLFFLPCVALIQPNGSLVELFSGAAAALAAGFAWRWAWGQWRTRRRPAAPRFAPLRRP